MKMKTIGMVAALAVATVTAKVCLAGYDMVTNVYNRISEVYAFTNVWERPVDEDARAEWNKDRLRWN